MNKETAEVALLKALSRRLYSIEIEMAEVKNRYNFCHKTYEIINQAHLNMINVRTQVENAEGWEISKLL